MKNIKIFIYLIILTLVFILLFVFTYIFGGMKYFLDQLLFFSLLFGVTFLFFFLAFKIYFYLQRRGVNFPYVNPFMVMCLLLSIVVGLTTISFFIAGNLLFGILNLIGFLSTIFIFSFFRHTNRTYVIRDEDDDEKKYDWSEHKIPLKSEDIQIDDDND